MISASTADEGKSTEKKTWTQTIDATLNFMMYNKHLNNKCSYPWHFICQAESNVNIKEETRVGFVDTYVTDEHRFLLMAKTTIRN